MRKNRILCLSLLSTILVAGLSNMTTAADDISLRLNWKMKGEFTPFVVAVQKGFFKAEGLNVKVNEGRGATQALQTVASGQDDIAYVPSIQTIKAINKGMPVKVVATVVKLDPMGMVSKSNIPLSKPKDLEGRIVEISPVSTLHQIWDAFAKKNNINVSKVKVVRAAPSARFGLLLNNKVDILGDVFLTNEYPVLQSKVKGKMNTLRVADWGFQLLGYTLVANNKLISGNPSAIRKFNAAAIRGFKFTLDHPDEAASIAAKAHPNALKLKTTKMQVAQLVDFIKRGKPAQMFIGDDAGWKRTLVVLKSSGVISKQKSLSDYYTNAFVPGIK